MVGWYFSLHLSLPKRRAHALHNRYISAAVSFPLITTPTFAEIQQEPGNLSFLNGNNKIDVEQVKLVKQIKYNFALN